jgi:hypothetical protein
VNDYGRGDRPGWPGQEGPGYGPPGPPPGSGGPGYGPGPYGPPTGGYPGPPTQQVPPPYGPPPGGQHTATLPAPHGGPPPDWPPPPGGPHTPPGGPPPPPGGGHAPPPSWNAPPRRRTPLVITAVVLVLALGAGVFGLVSWLNNRGGADSPAAAVQLLAGDLAAQNYLDAASRLHPAEATLAADLESVIGDELVRLEVLRPDAELTQGSVEVRDLRLDEAAAEQVRDNVVINQVVGGTITLDQGTGDLPFTDSFIQHAFPDGAPPAGEPTTIDLAEEVARNGEPIRVASVQVDGEWYVSAFYTLADYALRDAGLSWPSGTVPAVGAATPQDAVRDSVQAALDGDVRRLIELTAPDELQVLHDVGEVLVAEAQTEPSGARLLELETTETDVRGRTAVQLSRAVIEVEGEQLTLTRDGECLTATPASGGPERFCAADVLDEVGGSGDPTLERLAPALAQTVLDLQVVTSEVDGAHYVSPGQTVIELYGSVLGTLQPQDVRDLLDSMN